MSMLPYPQKVTHTEHISTEANYLKEEEMFGYRKVKTGANSRCRINASSKFTLILYSFLVIGRLYLSIYLCNNV
jgi:hypothetical protein